MNDAPVFDKDQELFIKNLRQKTAESHQKLEDNALSKTLLNPSVTLTDYQAYLSALYSITFACEDQVFPQIASLIPDLSQRHKSQLIENDLISTGFSREQVKSLPAFPMEISSVSEAMGTMYVLEGSTLGGRIIYKHIHAHLGLTPENGASYFWGYGASTGILWKSFISAFGNFAATAGDDEAIIGSAIKTFKNIDNWLSNNR